MKKNIGVDGVYWQLQKHLVLQCNDFDSNNNINFNTYIKVLNKIKIRNAKGKLVNAIRGFKKINIISGVCDFNKEDIIINNINKHTFNECEFNKILNKTTYVLNKEIFGGI